MIQSKPITDDKQTQKVIVVMQQCGCDMSRAKYYLESNNWLTAAAISHYWRDRSG